MKKVNFCLRLDRKDIIYHELLEIGHTINATRYSQQLKRLNFIKRIEPGHRNRKLIWIHDKAKTHLA